MTIHNTANDPTSGMLVLLEAMSSPTGDGSAAIYAMEKRGQAQLVNSDRLPTSLGTYTDNTDADYTALGFTFGEADPADPLFRPATLPAGWTRQASDHDMWSYVVDQHGRRRVAVFYKAAYYDRKAFMRLVSPREYLQTVFADGGQVVLDDWLTTEQATTVAAEIRDYETSQAAKADYYADNDTGVMDKSYWRGCAREHRRDAAKAQELIDSLPTTEPQP